MKKSFIKIIILIFLNLFINSCGLKKDDKNPNNYSENTDSSTDSSLFAKWINEDKFSNRIIKLEIKDGSFYYFVSCHADSGYSESSELISSFTMPNKISLNTMPSINICFLDFSKIFTKEIKYTLNSNTGVLVINNITFKKIN